MILLKADLSLRQTLFSDPRSVHLRELTKLKIESRLNHTQIFLQNFDPKKSNSVIFQVESKTRLH